MRIVHSRRPLVLASPSRECALIRATLSRSQGDPVLFLLTKPVREPIIFRTQEQHEAIQTARQQQTTKEFKERYDQRAGIEGTISQGVRAFDLRGSRYRGGTKTHLQHIFIATAMNVARLFRWSRGDTPFQPRISRFAALAA